MPASTTALTVVAANPVNGSAFNEQNSDADPGNSFPAKANKTRCYVRNTTVGALNVIAYGDKFGEEVALATVSIPGSATEHGVHILGPWPAEFLDHSTTDATKNGHVMLKQATGSDGDLVFCPFD